MNIVKCATIKVDEVTKKKMIDYYKKYTVSTPPPYSIFQAKKDDVTITLYTSLKCLFQGLRSEAESTLWLKVNPNLTIEPKKTKDAEASSKKAKYSYDELNIIGSDEVGTGDYFGPIVVAGVYLPKSLTSFLLELGIKDSKALTDTHIKKIAPILIKKISHHIMILTNKQYNEYSDELNMNQMKAFLHNKTLLALDEKHALETDYILIDQFVNQRKYFEYLEGQDKPQTKTVFEEKGESKSLAVACASVIARYTFLCQMEEISQQVGVALPLGASYKVDEIAKKIYQNKGEEYMKNITKYNFKNTTKIKNS